MRLAVAECYLGRRVDIVAHGIQSFTLVGTVEGQRRRIEVQEARIQRMLSNHLQSQTAHQAVEAELVQIVEGLCQSLFGEPGQIEAWILHDRRHIVRSQAISDAPQAMRSDEHTGQDDGDTFARRYLAQRMLANSVVDRFKDARTPQDIHDQGEMTEALWDFDLHRLSVQIMR